MDSLEHARRCSAGTETIGLPETRTVVLDGGDQRAHAKQIVTTWNRLFYYSSAYQKVPFLYLANDILQNSRRNGLEYINEFWKCLPEALNHVIEYGDSTGKDAVVRLVNIWEERKVFGSHGHILKDHILCRNRNNKIFGYNSKHHDGDMMEKLISCSEHVCDGLMDDDILYGRCQNAISFIKELEDIGSGFKIGNISGSEVVEELKRKHGILCECIEALKASKLSRSTLLSHIREVLHEQELKFDQICKHLQDAQFWYDQVGRQLCSCEQLPPLPAMPPSPTPPPPSKPPPMLPLPPQPGTFPLVPQPRPPPIPRFMHDVGRPLSVTYMYNSPPLLPKTPPLWSSQVGMPSLYPSPYPYCSFQGTESVSVFGQLPLPHYPRSSGE